jgi:hypothetical protein
MGGISISLAWPEFSHPLPVAHTLLIVRLVLRVGICVPADDDTVNECENSSRRRRAETKELLLAVGDALKMIISLGASLLE